MQKSLKEASLEGLRIILLGAISYFLTEGAISLAIDSWFHIVLDPTQKTIIIGVVTTILRSVDKWLHEFGKETGDKNLQAGLTRF